jgi:hypothetical protein
MPTVKSNDNIVLSNQIAETYNTLRVVLVVIGFALPPLLWLGYYICTGDPQLQDSMSAYYYAGNGVMRGWFVGCLFAIGALLFVYQGFTPPEDYALDIAGILALGVALFPMAWPVGKEDHRFTVHGICAFLFFLCIAYVCIFQASATLKLIRNKIRLKRYRRTYKVLGILMIVSPAAAFILTLIPWFRSSLLFFVEAGGVYVFAVYWLIKSREIRETQADHKAVRGELCAPRIHSLGDIFRERSVTDVSDPDVTTDGISPGREK